MKPSKKLLKPYVLRNETLKSIFSRECYKTSGKLTRNNRMTHIDCHTGLASFFSQQVNDGNEQLSRYTLNAHCRVCQQNKRIIHPVVPLSINMQQPILLHDIQSMIINDERSIRCGKCNEEMSSDRELNEIIAFEVEPRGEAVLED